MTFCVLPGLIVPMLNFSGAALAAASTSAMVRSGPSPLARIIRSKNATVEIGANAVTGSNGSVFITDRLIAIPLDSTNSV